MRLTCKPGSHYIMQYYTKTICKMNVKGYNDIKLNDITKTGPVDGREVV